MAHADQLRARLAQTERRILHQEARVAGLKALGGAGFEHASEGLRRLTDIRDAYARILAGPCPLTGEMPRRVDLAPQGEF